MNRTLLLIIGVIVALVVGVGAIVVVTTSRPAPTPIPTATPQVQAPLTISVTPSSTTLTASASASFDVLLNTNGVKIDGFQFIANLEGADVAVTDGDPVTEGVQITPVAVTGMNPVTNSVVAQGVTQVIRYAMITQSAGQPFSSSTATKVATVNFVPAATGTIRLDFNSQNTRANKTGTTQDTLITAASQTFTVGPALAATPAAAAAAATTTSVLSCDAACLTDNDCSIGLSCISNSCRAPACPNSSICSCTATGSAALAVAATPKPTPVIGGATATTSATPKPTVTPKATATPKTTATPKVASIAALPSALPESGSVETTIFLIIAGLLCMGLAAVLMLGAL